MEILLEFVKNQNWFNVVTAAIAFASAIAAVTPTPAQGTLLSKLYAVIDYLALNVGKAKNKGDSK